MQPGLSFDFGPFTLSASAALGKYFEPVVLFTGVLATPRIIREICFEMPRSEMSKELIAAWIVWHIDRGGREPGLNLVQEPDWLRLGRAHRHLLPWEIARAERAKELEDYAARPCCTVDRRVLRLSLNTLANVLAKTDPAAQVTVDFDGRVLSFRCGGMETLMGASGNAWPCSYHVVAKSLSENLSKRLMRPQVHVGIWQTTLQIDRCRFDVSLEM